MTIIVDDDDMDRYIARRRLAKVDGLGDIIEVETGDKFIDVICANAANFVGQPDPMVVLMDINMPGMDGFQTAEKLQSLVEQGEVPDSFIIMMFTSSKNPRDRERAEANPLIKGYIVKPIDDAAVEHIKALQAGESD